MPTLRLYDAHAHLQDCRFSTPIEHILTAAQNVGVQRIVVNGTAPEDWEQVRALAHRFPEIILPSFGLHPWKTPQPDVQWKKNLVSLLDQYPHAAIGECGLDRWISPVHPEAQEDAFRFQLNLAAERNLPLTIHCLKAWGWLLEILNDSPLPERGFLLHSFGGSKEIAQQLEALGGYFSFSGYFLQERKAKVQEAFQHIARERILIETDAPDMLPPAQWISHPLDSQLNHPANLARIAQGLAGILSENLPTLTQQLESNFQRFFQHPHLQDC